jgi:hypothetical protein
MSDFDAEAEAERLVVRVRNNYDSTERAEGHAVNALARAYAAGRASRQPVVDAAAAVKAGARAKNAPGFGEGHGAWVPAAVIDPLLRALHADTTIQDTEDPK